MAWLKNTIQGYLLQTFAIQSKKHPLVSVDIDEFIEFLESKLNFEHFENKREPLSLSISQILDSKRRGYLSS